MILRAGITFTAASVVGADDAASAQVFARLTIWYSLPAILLIVLFAAGTWPAQMRRWGTPLAIGTAMLTLGGAFVLAASPTSFVESVIPQGPRYVVRSGPFLYGLAAASALAEAFVVTVAVGAAARPDATAAERARAPWFAFAFSLLPLHSAAFFLAYAALGSTSLFTPAFVVRATATIGAGVIITAQLVRLSRTSGRLPRALVGVLAILAALGVVDAIAATFPALLFARAPGFEGSVLVVRVAFAFSLAVAATRYGMLGAGGGERARTAGIATAVLGVFLGMIVAFAAVSALGANAIGLAVAALVGAGTPVAVWGTLRRAAEQILLAPDDPRAVAERARTYAAAVAAAAGAGPEGERLLAQLRDDLGVSMREHDLLVQGVASRDREKYQKIETLGHGSTAQVELAVDEVAGKRVVIKRFKGLRDPAAVLQEARALAAVRHPRIVPFLEVDKRGDDVYLVLAYAEGGNARQLVEREGPLPPARALALARDVLEGLEALHAAGIMHCDLKLENLLLDVEGRGILGDFGSARFSAPDLADATLAGGAAEGSLSTISPEALRGAPPAPERDIYAAGALLYRLLTGEHYVELANATVFQAHERIRLDAPRLSHPRVPVALIPILAKALAKRPDERYHSARAFRESLDGVARA